MLSKVQMLEQLKNKKIYRLKLQTDSENYVGRSTSNTSNNV